MELAGAWRAAAADDTLRRQFHDPALDDDPWAEVTVPGHWRSSPELASCDGPVLYRRAFESPLPSGEPQRPRAWLDFHGVFYQGDIWLDGFYLGDTEGYFATHSFEVTEALAARREHLLAVEVTCSPSVDSAAKRNLTGSFQDARFIDPGWNPGGIWAPVNIVHTGPVRIMAVKALCQDARAERAIVNVEVELEAADATTVKVTTVLTPHQASDGHTAAPVVKTTAAQVVKIVEENLAGGRNRVRWRLTVDRPALWWPHALGDQPLHDIDVYVEVGGVTSDHRRIVTGLRQVRMRNFVATVNGERLFLKGTNLGPIRRELAEATAEECHRDVLLAKNAGLDLLRLHAHVSRPELYEAADREGMLIWQDLPLQGEYANVRRQAVRQARQAVRLLGHHPSVIIWCGHDEPFATFIPPGGAIDGRSARRFVAGQLLPGFNKTVLDGSLKRALERADRSRPVVSHSGVLPHPSGGTDSHLYCGWYHGGERDFPALLRRLPVLARFVSEFGAQALPEQAEWMDPGRWPELDWGRLELVNGLQRQLFDRWVPPADFSDFDAWRRASQDYQATVIRHHVETLRRLKYRPTGGFCHFLLADAQPRVSCSVLDHRRQAKAGYHALAAACAPVIVVADRPAASYRPGERVRLAVHAVSDLRAPLVDVTATATARWPGGQRSWRFAGDLPADSCTRIGKLDLTLPALIPRGRLEVDLEIVWSDTGGQHPGRAVNHYGAALEPGPAVEP